MRKFLSVAASIGLISSVGTLTTSCVSHYMTYKSIYVIASDVGKIKDKSFDEASYNATNKTINNLFSLIDKQLRKVRAGYAEPTDTNQMQMAYALANKNKAKVQILPSYRHLEYLDQIQEVMSDDATGIMIDGSGSKLSKIIGANYKADISGFEAGLAAIIWYFENHPNEKNVKISAYGGIENGLTVDPYLAGYFASIDIFNHLIKSQNFRETFKLNENVIASRIESQLTGPKKPDEASFFTNSFATGGGIQISESQLSQGSKIIFPVAGPQTGDTLGIIREQNKDAYVIGVDTDQVQQYDQYEKYFITSATKPIELSTVMAIMHSSYYKDYFDTQGRDFSEKYLELIESYGYVANDGSITFIDPDTNEEIPETDELLKNGSSWDGKDVWFSGAFASGGANQLKDDLHQQVLDFINEDNLDVIGASKNYFKLVSQGNENVVSLSNETVVQWENDLLANEKGGN